MLRFGPGPGRFRGPEDYLGRHLAQRAHLRTLPAQQLHDNATDLLLCGAGQRQDNDTGPGDPGDVRHRLSFCEHENYDRDGDFGRFVIDDVLSANDAAPTGSDVAAGGGGGKPRALRVCDRETVQGVMRAVQPQQLQVAALQRRAGAGYVAARSQRKGSALVAGLRRLAARPMPLHVRMLPQRVDEASGKVRTGLQGWQGRDILSLAGG